MAEPPAGGPAAGPTAAGTPPDYTSRMVAPVQVAVGVLVAAILLAVLVAAGLWPLGVAGCVLILAATWYLAAVTVTVSPTEVLLGQGRGKGGLRDVLVRNIDRCEVARFGWRDAIGSAPAPVSNTYVVRAGAGLRLALNDEETLNVSVRDPQAAAAVLRNAGVATTPQIDPSGGGD